MTQKTHVRLDAIDALRGLIMVLMALDHANYFIAQQHSSGEYWGGGFPAYNDPWHFIVRLVTHLSAPGFFLLMGVGMALYAQHHRRKGESCTKITINFVIRGIVLIVIQLLAIIQLWKLSPGGWGLTWYFGVLSALGGGMLICSFLVWLDARLLLGLAGSIFLFAEILTPNLAGWGRRFSFLISVFLVPGGQSGYWVNYPVLQWVELVIFGLVVGKWIVAEGLGQRVRQRLLGSGAVMLVVFLVLRLAGGFGNIRPNAGETWIDFFNVVKYPPSITYTLLTTGVNLVLLALFSYGKSDTHRRFIKPLVIFGRVPLFFYMTHLGEYAMLGAICAPLGTSLRLMVSYWLFGLLLLLPLCVLYGRLKRKTRGVFRTVLHYL